MPNPSSPMQALLQAKPNPNVQPKWTPEAEQTPHPAGDALLGASNFMLGMAGIGPDTQANRGGQLAGAMLPFGKLANGAEEFGEAMHPAVKALIESLETPLGEPNYQGITAGSGVMGNRYHDPEFVQPHILKHMPDERPMQAGDIVSPDAYDKGLKLESNPPGRSLPVSFRDASLQQDGYEPGFGQSAQNLHEYEPWREGYAHLDKKRQAPARALQPDISMREMSPAVKSLQELQSLPIDPKKIQPVERKPLSGLTHNNNSRSAAPLSDEQVKAIREAAASGTRAQDLAKQYGSSDASIRSLVKRSSYNWVK